jgi:cation-transporting ATPase E
VVLIETAPAHPVAPDLNGLTEDEVRARRARGEGNDVEPPTSRTYWQIVRANLFTVVNSILVALGVALLIFGRVSDAIITGGIVIVNAVINTVQEVRAKRQLDRIALLVHPQVTVIRAGQRAVINPREVVRGDLLVAQPGDQIVADGRIVGAGRIEVDEALLTGEADPINKERGDTVHSGSFCVSGSAPYLAEQVGADSLVNGLTASARSFRQVRTPLQREVDLLMRLLVVVVSFLGLLFALVAHFDGTPLTGRLQIAAVLAGLIPNGLIFMVTIAYAVGALRLVGNDLLIQQTNAIESFSNVDILCVDKTGTLTANRLEVAAVAPLALADEEFRQLLGTYMASVSAHNPTSAALAAAFSGEAQTARGEIPFNAARKWGALQLGDQAYTLGAPDILSATADLPAEPLREWVAQGLRVLLLAHLPDGLPAQQGSAPRLPGEIVPLGLVALREELRPASASTIRELAEAGVTVKVISGDHPTAVAALAMQAGLGTELRAISGAELADLNDAQLAQVAVSGTVFGRITPQQKARLIAALRSRGHYVAMIGDGVNDVLSLKEAQVGIAMQNGSAAARAVADLVLLRDSFGAVPIAFREGQRIITGLRDCLALYLARLAYMIVAILAIGLVTNTFPFSPKHTALISFFTLGAPTYFFVIWGQSGVQRRRGVVGGLLPFIVSGGLTMALLALASFVVAYGGWLDPALLLTSSQYGEAGVTVAARSALVTAAILGGLFLVGSLHLPIHGWIVPPTTRERLRPALLALCLLGIYAVVLAVPTLRTFFELVLLTPQAYTALTGGVIVWAGVLWAIWRARLTERLLHLHG